MARRKKPEAPAPGAFAPAVPTDTQEVLRLFVIAARAACARPDRLADIEAELQRVGQKLVPPESMAAEECVRLWRFFRRAAISPKPALRVEAGRAMYRDLESLGQRLDLPPLPSWDKLPAGLVAADQREDSSPTDVSLETVRRRAKRRLGRQVERAALPAAEVAGLLRLLDQAQLEQIFAQLVGEGFMGRAEGQMLVRWLAKGGELTDEDEALSEFLVRLGQWLVGP